MSDPRIVLPPESAAYRRLAAAAQADKAAFFVGLPGVGKTLMLQQMTLLSHAAGRPLHVLQWDVARQAFETPEILARYPEIEGSTHAAIRRAAGLWVRGAIARWAAAHAGDDALLLGEAPFVGNRLSELAHPEADSAEPFLSASTTHFIIPAPTLAVRAAIERRRARDLESPRHAREAANAPLNLLDLLMQDLRSAGAALEIPCAPDAAGYDPAIYLAIYTRLLQHRHVHALMIDECWRVDSSAYDRGIDVTELQPSPAEVAAAMECVEALGPDALERAVSGWYRPAASA
jgi:hypothetical protein